MHCMSYPQRFSSRTDEEKNNRRDLLTQAHLENGCLNRPVGDGGDPSQTKVTLVGIYVKNIAHLLINNGGDGI